MTRLHFQPIKDKSLDILDTILKNEDVAAVDEIWRRLGVVVEEIDVEITRDEESITLCFHDGGELFNPLEREEPDFTVPLEDRKIGGLGIFMVIKYMDTVTFSHSGGENILTVMKKIKVKK